MAIISILSRLVSGVQRNVDLSTNTLKVDILQALTKVRLGDDVTFTDVNKTGYDALVSHAASTSNPHTVTKAQVGLTNVTDNAQVKGLASGTTSGNLVAFGADGYTVADSGSKPADFAATGHNHSGVYEPANSNIQSHISSTSNPHSVTKAQIGLTNVTNDAQLALAGGTMSGFITLHTDPTSAMHATTKQYVDAVAQGLDIHSAVHLATTAALDVTASGSGVGKTLTFNNVNIQSIDGHQLAVNDRVLVKNQGTPFHDNGIYKVTQQGDADTLPCILTRAVDFDGSPAAEVHAGDFMFVETGSINGSTGWVLAAYNNTNPVIDTDPMVFNQFSGAGTYSTDGQGIELSGTQLYIELDGTTLSKSGSGLKVNSIDNNQIAAAAGIVYSKLSIASGDIALAKLAAGTPGQIIVAAATTGTPTYVSMSGDVTIGNTGVATIGSGRVTSDMLAGSIADSKLSQITTASKVAGSAVQLGSNPGLQDSTGLMVKLDTNSGLALGAGGLSVVHPAQKPFLAGESFAANTSFLVRMAVTGETAGRVYKATNDTTTSDLFYAIGYVSPTVLVNIGDAIIVQSFSSMTLGSSDTAFNAADIGKPVYLTTAGAFSITVPAAGKAAVVQVGVVQETSKIWIQPMRIMGVNE